MASRKSSKSTPIRVEPVAAPEREEKMGQPDMSLRTVNGEPIPVHLEHLVPYEHTDQGKWEAAQRPNVRRGGPRVEVISSEFDRSLERMADAPFLNTDPFREAVAGLREKFPGDRFRMLSDKVVQRKGRRGWEPVIDQKTGDPVKVGGMVLGRMPGAIADQRNRHYQEEGNERLRDIEGKYQSDQEKHVYEARRRGMDASVLRPGEVLHDGRDPERSAVTGVHATRGLGRDAQ